MTESYLFIINNAPYRDERPFNALRLASTRIKNERHLHKGEQKAGGRCSSEAGVVGVESLGRDCFGDMVHLMDLVDWEAVVLMVTGKADSASALPVIDRSLFSSAAGAA